MQNFDLSILDYSGKSIATFPPAPQPYGSFSRGDAFDLNGQRFTIDLVAHTVVLNGSNQLCRTLLILVPFAAGGLPDSHSFPQVASGSGGGWVVGNG